MALPRKDGDGEAVVHIRLHPKQALVLKSPANEILFGGAAGPGKSFLVRAAAIAYCTAIPRFQAYLFRRTYPELWQTHMEGPGSFRVLLARAVPETVLLLHCRFEKLPFQE